MVRTWGRIPLGKFLVAELNIQYPVKSFAPYLGGRRGRVPSDSLRKFLQEVNLYNSFKLFFIFLYKFIFQKSLYSTLWWMVTQENNHITIQSEKVLKHHHWGSFPRSALASKKKHWMYQPHWRIGSHVYWLQFWKQRRRFGGR